MENLEEFVPIKGFENEYEINRTGIVISLERYVKGKGGCKLFKKRTIKHATLNKYGYLIVTLSKNKQLKLHRALAIAFIPNPDNHPIINHINGIKTDNRIENLEWCTYKHNAIHAVKTGLNCSKHRKVMCLETGSTWPSIQSCAIELGINANTLNYYLLGKRKNKTSLRLL